MNKSEILQIIHDKLSEKIATLEKMISETRASNNETKSSMGDKYETSREMVQQQINNLQVQLNENINARNSLKIINTNLHQTVGLGSVVETDKGLFYIAVSLGEIIFNENKIFVISTESPFGKALFGKRKGDEISLNNTKQTIQNLW
ncbi:MULTISPECIES: GreA/GreB family elongation factor [unclassified Kaistella]|uniref:GreA/GreB family elongation factor n=1 Tax=unclassified Kaistella TaxID=2762626 RepID=UPI00273287EE|nr:MULTISPECIES: GreA/GreB family elongation factor [unclassified Kaistella]MDP2453435.1 GreA/GreB family elongation factor [Kaistella sp. SH11-4b]MDP2456492.1 GreA/GreB family elongation factor [Kaistella sp. SH40-3]MDP2459248.1 GreA/GreB family elongation factor [Kaistella sp. SH19-2b]